MKIKNLVSSQNFLMNGLKFKEMRDLKQVVALFGKNGSGKSRLLNILPNEIQAKINKKIQLDNSLSKLGFPLAGKLPIDFAPQEFRSLTREKEEIMREIEFEDGGNWITITGRNLRINPLDNMQEQEYRQATLNIITNPDFQSVKQNCAKFIKALCRSEMSMEYHKSISGKKYFAEHDAIQNKNIKLYYLLKNVITKIINKELDYTVDEHLTPVVTLDGRLLDPNELSDGEKELLAYCTYIVLQNQDEILNKSLSLKNKILLLDEPELFLHPQAQIDLIKGLRELVGKDGQIWIATHSLSILSILDRDEIWLMENGDVISPSIETPNKVLTSLIGEENITSLENFLSSQYEWASIQFALESLFPPTTVPFKKNDVQQTQVSDRLMASERPIKVLDFGAGEGRVAQEILRNINCASNTYYQSLEINIGSHDQLRRLTSELQKLSTINNEIEREVLDSHEKLNEQQYNNFFDYILLINVLHEIPLNKWNSILNTLLKSLKDNGKIIILEDQALPRGENAHEYGFLILDVEELKCLFSMKNPPISFKHTDPKYSERLTCIEIPKKDSIVSSESIKGALQRKKTNCKTALNKLRVKENKSAKDGRTNSFLTQLYANVDMALADFQP